MLNKTALIKYERYIKDMSYSFFLFYINVLHQITLNNEILMKKIYSIVDIRELNFNEL